MKQYLNLLLVCLVFFTNKVQAEDYQSLFEQNIQLVYGFQKTSFKGQALKGKRNGMGILPMKNGAFYFGDFSQNDISGIGMMISPKQNINNCLECFVYAGNWESNKKNGFGRCYDIEGKLIYEGQFENDLFNGYGIEIGVKRYCSSSWERKKIKEVGLIGFERQMRRGVKIYLSYFQEMKPNG